MKLSLKVSCLLVCLAYIAASCKKDNTAKPEETFTPALKGKLDGTPFNCTMNLYAANSATNDLKFGGIFATGGINLTLKNFNNTIGQWPLDANSYIGITGSGAFWYAGVITMGPGMGSGKITITTVTGTYIKGTFECVAPADPFYCSACPPVTVTEGEFELKRQ